MTSSWPQLTPHDLWPSNVLFLGQGFFLSKLVAIGHSCAMWPLVDPFITFDHSNTLLFGQGFFLPNLVAIGHFKNNLTSWWPLTFGRVASKIFSQTSKPVPYSHAKFQLHTSKYDETHSRTCTLKYIQTSIF